MCSNNDIIRILTLYASVRQCYFQLTTNLNMSQEGRVFKQRCYLKFNNLSLRRQVLLSGNVQSEHVAEGENCSNNYITGTLTIQASVGQCYFQVTSNLNMPQQGKCFKQRYYQNIDTFSMCGPVLLSGNDQSENFATGESFHTTILSEPQQFKHLQASVTFR